MESAGEAHLFLLPTEMPYVDVLRSRGIELEEELVGQFLSEHSQQNLLLLRKVNALYRDPVFQQLQRVIFDIVAGSKRIHTLAADAYRSFLRAYARYAFSTLSPLSNRRESPFHPRTRKRTIVGLK